MDTRQSSFGGGKGGPKVLQVWLVVEQLYRTDGTVTWLADVRDVPELKGLGPLIKQIRVLYEAESCTTQFKAQVTMAWSISGKVWSTSAVLHGPVTGNSHTIGNWYTNDLNFGPRLRFAIEVSNNSGALLENGRLTIGLEVELRS